MSKNPIIKSGVVYSESSENESDFDEVNVKNPKKNMDSFKNGDGKMNGKFNEKFVDSESEEEFKPFKSAKQIIPNSLNSNFENKKHVGSDQRKNVTPNFESESSSDFECESKKSSSSTSKMAGKVENDKRLKNNFEKSNENLQFRPAIKKGIVLDSDSESETENKKGNCGKAGLNQSRIVPRTDSKPDSTEKHPKIPVSKNIKINSGVVYSSDDESNDTIPKSNPSIPTSKEVQPIPQLTSEPALVISEADLIASKSLKPEIDEEIVDIIENFKKSEMNPELWKTVLDINAEKNFQVKKLTFQCCVCLENYYKTDDYGECSPIFNDNYDKRRKVHQICQECLRQTTLPENVNLDPHGAGIKCPSGECPNLMLISDIQKFLDANVKDQLLERIGNMSIAAAEIPNLYRCENCGVLIQVETDEPNYICYNCQRNNCKNCEREYVGDHVGRTCQELIDYEKKEIIRKKVVKVEAQMNDIVVHKCHKCNLQFIQEGGCNKMTCSCGATQCYLCRARDIDYNHFGNNKQCQLYANVKKIEQQKLDEHRRQNNI